MGYREYAEQVCSGSIVSCEYTKLACQRFLDDLNRSDLIFKEKKHCLLMYSHLIIL